MKKYILLLLVFILMFQSVFGATTIKISGTNEGWKSLGKNLNNGPLNPLDNSSLMNDLTIDGKRPKKIIIYSEPDFVEDPHDKKIYNVYYKHNYIAFYDEFKEGKFVVNEGESVKSISFGHGYLEEIKIKTALIDTKGNGYDSNSVKTFILDGYIPSTNRYNNPSLKLKDNYIGKLFIATDGSYEFLGSVPYTYKILDVDTEGLFVKPDDSPFQLGAMPGATPMDSKPLAIIPEMVKVAVVFLVFLMVSLIVLKVSLKVLRIFLPI